MALFRKFLKLKYTGKILSACFTVAQTWLMYYVLGKMASFVKHDTFSMSVVSAILSLIILVLSVAKDHIANNIDVNSDVNKEKALHKETTKELNKIKEELEEKKDHIHTMISCFNNTFLDKKSSSEQLNQVKELLKEINKDKKISNCGNSKMSRGGKNSFLRDFIEM